MLQLRTAAFFLGWTLATLAVGLFAFPALLSQKLAWRVSRAWAGFTLAWLRITCGITSVVEGRPETHLIACNHQSAWDTLMLFRLLGNPAFVLKRELYLIPIFGWFLWRTGQIAIDRSDGRSAYAQIEKQATPILADGRTIIVFPEGTRVRPGAHKQWRSGIARISGMLQLPVTPAALNAGWFWPKHSLVKRPGTAVLKFLPPMPVCEDQAAWMQQLETTIQKEATALAARAE